MKSKFLMALFALISWGMSASADTVVVCRGKDLIGREVQVSYLLEEKTILVKEQPTQPWKVAFDNIDDAASSNKQAYDSIACARNGAGGVNGDLKAKFFGNGEGHFWCSIHGARRYNYKLSECSYERNP